MKRLAVALLSLLAALTVQFGVAVVPAHALTCQQTLQKPDQFGNIYFYHGTSRTYAQDIAANGINLSKSSADTDFGRGFYITTDEGQAAEWAHKNFWNAHPTIVEYYVPLSALTPGVLCGQVFNGPTSAYLNFVKTMRTTKPPIGGGGYDFVEGPLMLNFKEWQNGAPPDTGGQQDSIHTSFAVSIFNSDFVSYMDAPGVSVGLHLRSLANNNWTSAELGYTGGNYAMLRARASSIGPWEQFYTVWFPTPQYPGNEFGFYNGANGNYVSAELGYTGGNYAMLRARAAKIGPWESYYMIELSDGTIAIQSAANNNFVSAELGYTGGNYAMLRARASSIGPWETFTDDSWSTSCTSCE